MKASQRRDALAGWLRAHPGVSAAAAAERFGVSERTIWRDVAALRADGSPVEGEPGPGGGLRLDPRHGRTSVEFSIEELAGLVLLNGVAMQAVGFPFRGATGGAIGRMTAALPPGQAARLREFLDRVVIAPPLDPEWAAWVEPVNERVVRVFEEAFARRRRFAFSYVDRLGERTRREVEPHGLLVRWPAWYALTFDHLREAPRVFRLDRMSRPAIASTTFEPRPADIIAALLPPKYGPQQPLHGGGRG